MAGLSIQAFRQQVTVEWPRQQDRDAKAHLLRVGRSGHDRIMADARSRSGSSPAWEAYANRPGNSNLESVVLPGPLVWKYRYAGEIIKDALMALQKASPVKSGLYAKSHMVFVNGAAVSTIPNALKPGDEVMISNPVPYARRIEIGKTEAGRDFIITVPNRIYERVATKVLMPKYRNVAKIRFGFVELPGGYATKGALKSHYIARGGARRKRRQKRGAAVMSPAIFIEALS
jgi:hypothetical protein